MQNNVRVGETVVDSRELFFVIDGDEALARRRVKLFRFDVLIAAKIKIADVVLYLSGRKQIAVFQEHFTRPQRARDRLVVQTKHRKRDHFAHFRGRCDMWFVECEKSFASAVESRTSSFRSFAAMAIDISGWLACRGARSATPEVDPVNALPRVRQPTLVLSGEFDPMVPLANARRYFALLGAPAADKRHVIAIGGHFIPRDLLIRETLDWLDTRLGRTGR